MSKEIDDLKKIVEEAAEAKSSEAIIEATSNLQERARARVKNQGGFKLRLEFFNYSINSQIYSSWNYSNHCGLWAYSKPLDLFLFSGVLK